MLKIDVEGHEYRALLGATQLLEHRPVVITEYDPELQNKNSGVDGAEYLRAFVDCDYRLSVIRAGGLEPVADIGRLNAECVSGIHVDLLLEPKHRISS